MSWTDGYGGCTGTVIAEDAIITAAHCVYDIVDKESARGGVVIPAVANNSFQYGSYIIEDYYYPAGYRNFNNAENQPAINYDYAILVVDTYEGHEIGDVVGTLPIKQVGQTIKGTSIKVYGYPGDKVESTGVYDQWGMSGSITDEVVEIAYYTLDTARGQSGAAILNASNQIIGVHSSGWFDGTGKYIYNGGGKMSSHQPTSCLMITLTFWGHLALFNQDRSSFL